MQVLKRIKKHHIIVTILCIFLLIISTLNFFIQTPKDSKASGAVSFSDTDWGGSNYSSSTSETDLFSGNLLLKNNYSSLVEAFDPTTRNLTFGLTVLNDKLYLSTVTDFNEDGGGVSDSQLMKYDYKTDQVSEELLVRDDQGINYIQQLIIRLCLLALILLLEIIYLEICMSMMDLT